MNDRILARHVEIDGRRYGLSIVTITNDKVHIEPFVSETASTRFVDGTLVITTSPFALKVINEESAPQ